jgi:hypothetical protein
VLGRCLLDLDGNGKAAMTQTGGQALDRSGGFRVVFRFSDV